LCAAGGDGDNDTRKQQPGHIGEEIDLEGGGSNGAGTK
jgi:hypothetical protein